MRQRRRRDPEIVHVDHFPRVLEFRPDTGVDASDFRVDWDLLDRAKDLLDHRLAPEPARSVVGAMHAVSTR